LIAEDTFLILQFKSGGSEALGRIYEKYVLMLHKVAVLLVADPCTAEDVVHDVFVKFARSADTIRIGGSLKFYLIKCVVNRARDIIRSKKPYVNIESSETASSMNGPDEILQQSENKRIAADALAYLPSEQREVIVMHLCGRMKFRQIADSLDMSINTVQSRYRYGIEKLRHIVNGELEK
jgi:RNA polymerase sigma-70 factor (ECF subfamily)